MQEEWTACKAEDAGGRRQRGWSGMAAPGACVLTAGCREASVGPLWSFTSGRSKMLSDGRSEIRDMMNVESVVCLLPL